jgi:predicted transcriptional regulator
MFGLSTSTALKSKKVRLRQSEVMVEMRKQKKHRWRFEKNNSFAGNRKGKPKSVETVNKYGVCDLQIRDRILKLKKN